MPKKKATKKVVVEKEVLDPFDLSFEDQEKNEIIRVALRSLKANSGWRFLTEIFQKNLEVLTEYIVSKTDENGKELTDEEIDVLRIKHGYIKELLDKPDWFIKKLSREEEVEEDLDPYDR